MNFLILALCTEGEATYTLDTQGMKIQKNDVLLILDRHVVSNFTASKDLKALCLPGR